MTDTLFDGYDPVLSLSLLGDPCWRLTDRLVESLVLNLDRMAMELAALEATMEAGS